MPAKIPVTVVIPVRNEEAILAECLEQLGSFEKVVVVDSGSTDRTAAIARQHGAIVLDFTWNGRYPKKRNWYLINHPPQTEWVLFLDADEIVDGRFCQALCDAIADPRYNGHWLTYTNYFLGRRLRHGVEQRKLALFRVGKALYERIEENGWSKLDMEVHEHPIVEGETGVIRAPIDHRDMRGLAHFLRRHVEYAEWEARRIAAIRSASPEDWRKLTRRQRLKYRHIVSWWFAPAYFVWNFLAKRGFLDGQAGFALSLYKMWYFFTVRKIANEQ